MSSNYRSRVARNRQIRKICGTFSVGEVRKVDWNSGSPCIFPRRAVGKLAHGTIVIIIKDDGKNITVRDQTFIEHVLSAKFRAYLLPL